MVPLHAVMVRPGLRSVNLHSSFVVCTWAPVSNSYWPVGSCSILLAHIMWILRRLALTSVIRAPWSSSKSSSLSSLYALESIFFTPNPWLLDSHFLVRYSRSVCPIPRHPLTSMQYLQVLDVSMGPVGFVPWFPPFSALSTTGSVLLPVHAPW